MPTVYAGAFTSDLIGSEDVTEASIEINQTVFAQVQEEGGRVSTETLLAATAAVLGESVRLAATKDNPDRGIVFLNSVSEILKLQIIDHCPDTEFLSFAKMSSRAAESGGLDQTYDAYYDPHIKPDVFAALSRADIKKIAGKYNLSEWEQASAATFALLRTVDYIFEHLPPDIIYQLAIETALGVAHEPGKSQEAAEQIKKAYDEPIRITQSCNAAAHILKHMFMIAAVQTTTPKNEDKQELLRRRIATTIAIAGALAGEMSLRAIMPQVLNEPKMIICAEANRFFSKIYPSFVGMASHPSERKERLPHFSEIIKHTVKSFGSNPFPVLTAPETDCPTSWPPYIAEVIHDDVMKVAKKFTLNAWELTQACFAAAVHTIAEDHKAILPTTSAIRIFMDEAVGMSHITPVDLDATYKSAPPDIKKAMDTLHQNIRGAIKKELTL